MEETKSDVPIKKQKIKDVEKKLEELRNQCAEYLNGWKRAQADYQNLVKDTSRREFEYVKYANSQLIVQLLPILDNFKSAFKLIPEAEKNSAWVVGFSYIRKQLEDVLKSNGVEEIKTVGESLNTNEHEAVEHTEREGVEENMIIEERQSGYKLNGKVIQAAKVVVSKKKE